MRSVIDTRWDPQVLVGQRMGGRRIAALLEVGLDTATYQLDAGRGDGQHAAGSWIGICLLPEFAGNPVIEQDFRAQSQVSMVLRHPALMRGMRRGVVRLPAAAPNGVSRLPAYCLENAEGIRLRQVLEEQGPMSLQRAGAIILFLASALAALHRGGLAHGHLGLDEVQMGPDGLPKIRGSRFAAAAQGTRLELGLADPRDDQRALGGMLLALVGGRDAKPGTLGEDWNRDIKRTLARLLAENPLERFPNLEEGIRHLEHGLGLRRSLSELVRVDAGWASVLRRQPKIRHRDGVPLARGELTATEDRNTKPPPAQDIMAKNLAVVTELKAAVRAFSLHPLAKLNRLPDGWVLAATWVGVPVLLAGIHSAWLALVLMGAWPAWLMGRTAGGLLAGRKLGPAAWVDSLSRSVTQWDGISLAVALVPWTVLASLAALTGLAETVGGGLLALAGLGMVFEGIVGTVLDRARNPLLRSIAQCLVRMREWGATEDEILATLAMPETTGHWLEAVEALQGFEALQNARFQARTVAPDISMPWDPRLNLAALGDVLARGALARRAARLARHPRRTAHRAIGEQIPPSPEAPLPATMEPGNDGTAMAVRGAGSFRGPIALAPAPQSMQAASLIQMRLTQQALGEMPMALIEARTLLAQGSWVLGVSVIIVALISFPDLQKFASLTSPKQIVPLVEGFGRMGLGTTPWGLFIGVVLIFGGMQRSLLRILCILSGAWILLFTRPLVDMVAFPNFDLSMAVWTGWVLIGLSLAYGPLFRYAGRGGSRFAGLRV